MTLLVSCNQPNVEQEKSNAEAAINGFYSAAEKFDYQAIQTYCTSDFTAFEDGYTYANINEFIDLLKSFEGATFDIKMNFVNTEVIGNMAFSVVEFDASFTKDPVKISFKTYENYILKKIDNKWLIHYFQSTHLPDPDDKNFASIHFLQVSDRLSISNLEQELDKFNQTIMSMGYADCGYKILKVIPESNDKYNYVLYGDWKNQETYDIIHESEAFKKIQENMPDELNSFFNGQVYLKVSLDE